jgi:hypothetical protein
MYSGISNAMVTISRVEGFRTLWKGLSSVVMGAGGAIKSWVRGAMALTVLQVPRMLSILRLTKLQNTPWAATRAEAKSTILLQQVRKINDLII